MAPIDEESSNCSTRSSPVAHPAGPLRHPHTGTVGRVLLHQRLAGGDAVSPGAGLGGIELSTLQYIDQPRHRRLHGEIDMITRAELEATYCVKSTQPTRPKLNNRAFAEPGTVQSVCVPNMTGGSGDQKPPQPALVRGVSQQTATQDRSPFEGERR